MGQAHEMNVTVIINVFPWKLPFSLLVSFFFLVTSNVLLNAAFHTEERRKGTPLQYHMEISNKFEFRLYYDNGL